MLRNPRIHEFPARPEEHKEILDSAWVLFSRLEDTDAKEVVDAALFFVNQYDFSVDELPPTLHEAVERELWQDCKEEYLEGVN
tara:strand:+ start:257 stop:505 length:249 start_codon:yes stop_codon:yes gene_type:complete